MGMPVSAEIVFSSPDFPAAANFNMALIYWRSGLNVLWKFLESRVTLSCCLLIEPSIFQGGNAYFFGPLY